MTQDDRPLLRLALAVVVAAGIVGSGAVAWVTAEGSKGPIFLWTGFAFASAVAWLVASEARQWTALGAAFVLGIFAWLTTAFLLFPPAVAAAVFVTACLPRHQAPQGFVPTSGTAA